MPITSPTEKYFKDGGWGYDGSQWRALAMLWGYSDRYAEKEESEDASAGANYLVFSTVPSGEVWVVTNIATRDRDNAPSEVGLQLYDGTDAFVLASEPSPVANTWHAWSINVVLKAGDKIRAYYFGVTLDDHIEAQVVGYKMTIDEG